MITVLSQETSCKDSNLCNRPDSLSAFIIQMLIPYHRKKVKYPQLVSLAKMPAYVSLYKTI